MIGVWASVFPQTPIGESETGVDFEAQPPGSSAELPSWMTFTRSSDQFTVQSSSSTVVSGLTGANRPYIGNRGGSSGTSWGTGLSFEEERTQLHITNPRSIAALPSAGTVSSVAYGVGPDGGGSPERVTTSLSTDRSRSLQSANHPAGYIVVSEWLYSPTGTTSQFVSVPVVALYALSASTWIRGSVWSPHEAGTTLGHVPVDGRDWSVSGGISSAPRDVVVDFMQIEEGWYATESITAATATRTGPSMSTSDRSQVLRTDGRLVSIVDLTLSGAPSQYPGAIQVSPYFSANDAGASISNTTGKLSVTIGGNTWTPNVDLNLYLWAGSRVQIAISAGGGALTTKAKIRFENGTVLDLGESSSPQAAISLSGSCYLLDNNGSNVPTGLIHSLKYKVEPSWFTSSTTAWIPSALSPSLWLRGGLGVTLGTVGCSTWSDQSGNSRNISQSTGNKQPLYIVKDRAMQGRPSLRFSSSVSKIIAGAMTGLSSDSAYSIYGVFKRNSSNNTNNPIFSLAENPYATDSKAILSFHAGNSDAFMYGHAAGVYTSIGAIPAVETCTLVGGKINPGATGGLVWRYNSTTTTVDAPTHGAGDVLLQVGGEAHGGGGTYSDSSTAEIIVVNRVITAAEEAALIAYFNLGYRQTWQI